MATPTENQRAAWAHELLEHPAWDEAMAEIRRQAIDARRVIFSPPGDTPDQQALASAFARGSLKVLGAIVKAIHERANKEVPPTVKSLFE